MDDHAIACQVRQWIVDVLMGRPDIVELAVRQRAKFEGWLKFELAAAAVRAGARDVVLEAPLPGGPMRADLGFTFAGRTHFVELKTPNSNWRMAGVENKGRPVTMNIDSIIVDGNKMRDAGGGIVAFAFFPIPAEDIRWREYLVRIATQLDTPLSEEEHCSRVPVQLGAGDAQVVVSAFWLGPHE